MREHTRSPRIPTIGGCLGMKALVLTDYGRFTFEEVPDPQIAPDDVLVRVKACGICGSDVHGMDGSTGRRLPPIIMGHEASGVIATTGGSVARWKTGDRVTFDSTIYCGDCDFCRAGRINLCSNRRVLGVSCDDYRQNGAFAEFVAVPQQDSLSPACVAAVRVRCVRRACLHCRPCGASGRSGSRPVRRCRWSGDNRPAANPSAARVRLHPCDRR